MDTPHKEKHARPRSTSPATTAHDTRQASPPPRRPGSPKTSGGIRGDIRTCIPALRGRGGYREPADAGPDSHIVRGED